MNPKFALKFNFLSKKELKPIFAAMKEEFGIEDEVDGFYHMNKQGKLHLVERSVDQIPLENYNTKSAGIYIGEWKEGEFRFSIEGSQVFGPLCKHHVLEITSEQVAEWMRGEDMKIESDLKGFVMIKSGDDFMGCGKIAQGKLWNFIPKGRRVKIIQ